MNLFWELLSIISECDASKLFDVETESVEIEVKISSARNFYLRSKSLSTSV